MGTIGKQHEVKMMYDVTVNTKVNKDESNDNCTKKPPGWGKGERMTLSETIPFMLSYRGLDCQEFSVFLHIIARAGGGNGCFESIPNMADRLKLGIKTLRNVINRLIEYRLIYKAEDRPGYSSVYEACAQSEWMSSEEIELKRNELRAEAARNRKNKTTKSVEKINLASENPKPKMKVTMETNSTTNQQDEAQGLKQQESLDVYPGNNDSSGKNDRGTQVTFDRGILNIENLNKKNNILEREEKKEDHHSTKASLSGTEEGKKEDHSQAARREERIEKLFDDCPPGKQKREISTEQFAILQRWIPSGALKKVFSVQDDGVKEPEEKEVKPAAQKVEPPKRSFGCFGYDASGHKKTPGQVEQKQSLVKPYYAPIEEHPNYPVNSSANPVPEPVSVIEPHVEEYVEEEVKQIEPQKQVVNAVETVDNSVNVPEVIEPELEVLEAKIVPTEKTNSSGLSVLDRVEKPRLAKFDVNDQKLIDRVETYREAFYQGKTNFTPFQLQEWAAVDGMSPILKAYRKSGRLMNSAPNDISFEFICWLNNQHSRGANQKDDGYALNYIKKMERSPGDWDTLTALVTQWQGSKKTGNSNFRISQAVRYSQEEAQLAEIQKITASAGLSWTHRQKNQTP